MVLWDVVYTTREREVCVVVLLPLEVVYTAKD
jgi:hypothetical protein